MTLRNRFMLFPLPPMDSSARQVSRSHLALLAILTMAMTALLPSRVIAQDGASMPSNKQRHQLRYKAHEGEPLTLIEPTDPMFDAEVSVYFSDYETLPGFQQWKPFLVILRNDTQKTARAYEVIWHLLSQDANTGDVSEEVFGRQSAITTPLEIRRPGGVWEGDKSIRPGEVRLLSPFFNGGKGQLADFNFFHRSSELPNIGPGSVIKPQLDCVVYGDGSIAGPNRTRLALRYFVTRDAQHDEALAVARRLRESPNAPELKSALAMRGRIGSSNRSSNNRALPVYIHSRAVAAQELDAILERDGYSKLKEVVEELVSLMPPHEQFTQLGGQYHRSTFEVNGVTVSPSD